MTHKCFAQIRQAESVAYVYLMTAVAAVGGFLFGFDTAIIAGAIGFIKEHFALNATQEGFAVSCVLVGCMVGATTAGALSDRIGRKKVMFTAAVLFVITAILAAIPRTLMQFVGARFLMGIAVGIESVLSPLYIAEIAPARIRGRLVTLNHVALVIGLICAYTIGWALAGLGPALNWRWMFASGAVPAAVFLVALIRIPESPRWLAKKGRLDEARAILARIGGRDHAQVELAEIRATLAREGGSIFQLLRPGLRIALFIGVGLAFFQQITGINSITYYAPEVFKEAGFPIEEALAVSILVGVVNLVINLLLACIFDKVGRKPLILIGTSGTGLCLLLTGLSFHTHAFSPGWTAAFILGYVACFAIGLGPAVWLVLSEIYPTRIRGRAMSIATFNVWAWCFVISLTFPILLDRIGPAKTFWLYGAMCILTFVFVCRFVPETKGRTLEEIEKMWMSKANR